VTDQTSTYKKVGNTDTALRRGWHAVALASEVTTTPLHVSLLGDDWVLVRLPGEHGPELTAFVDRCPHRFAPLSAGTVEGDTLRCPYHGWCFKADGACTEIPSQTASDKVPPRARATTPWGVTEQAGIVFLAPEEPVADIPDLSIADDDSFLHGALDAVRARVGAGLVIDNFIDMAHFPYVHAATIGTEEATAFEDLEVTREGFVMTAVGEHPFPNHEDPGVAEGIRPLLQNRRLTYEYRAPFLATLTIEYVEAGGVNVLHFFVQPEDEHHCRVYTLLHRNDLDGDTGRLAEAVAFETKILEEDVALQERFVDLTLPVDPTAEVHVRADRPSLEYRRILADLLALA
jgi:phenylpropionate dioxygenase-like ring-hydroxylating dioxygenase large terminal subunit